MITIKRNKLQSVTAIGIAFWMLAGPMLVDVTGQQRSRSTTSRSTTTRSTTSRTTATRSTTTTHRTTTTATGYHHGSTAYHGGTGYHGGTVYHGEEGYAAVGHRGAVAVGEEGAAAVTRRGVVVAGEEGYAAAGRYGGVVVGHTYETYEAWRVVAGTATVIAIGTMLARPPTAATVVVVSGSSYWVYQNTYYTRVYVGGVVHYQVVARPL